MTMTMERAQAINAALLNLAMERDDIAKCRQDQITLLRAASLEDLITATRMIERANDQARETGGTMTFSVTCDDRFIAAAYTFLHFALPPAMNVYDDDYAVVVTRDPFPGFTTFLLVGHRQTAVDQPEE